MRRIWDLTTRKILLDMTPQIGLNGTFSGSFSPDGRRLATIGNQGIDLWDTVGGHRTFTLRGFGETPSGVLFTPDGDHLIMIADTVKIWDATP